MINYLVKGFPSVLATEHGETETDKVGAALPAKLSNPKSEPNLQSSFVFPRGEVEPNRTAKSG